ncbi:MAG TPA: RNA polymerase sigma factor [Chthonomonadales bacterium]|nr:RNA polymerase sigma factor [Chthonomonadales bacterium]
MSERRAAAPSDGDEALVERHLAGDTSAFDELFRRHQNYVYNIVFGVVGRPEDARDITQDVFVQAHRALPSFRRGSRFMTWLYRIAVNRAVDHVRAASRRRWLPFDLAMRYAPDPSEGPAEVAQRSAEQALVQRVLCELPVQHREVLSLRYYRDLSVEEIAEVMRCSTDAAKLRLHRARARFREKYVEIERESKSAPLPVR